jgi:acetamidase/formamidase
MGFQVTDEGGIFYMSPDPAALKWKVPLRPHIGTLAVMPNNTENYIDEEASGGANTIPPARFGGNIGKSNGGGGPNQLAIDLGFHSLIYLLKICINFILDDWRIGKGGTMFYNVEVPGAMIVVGDTHAAQGDSELAGTAMETSMTTKLRITLHKAGNLPKKVASMPFPLLETSTQYVIHGFAYANYLDDIEDASDIFSEGATLDLAMTDCFIKTRNWLMDVFDLIEEETIALMTTAVDFGITQVVDGNWGVHADIDKWVFEEGDTPYDYSCTTSKSPGRTRRGRMLKQQDRRRLLEMHGIDMPPEDYASNLYSRVTEDCEICSSSGARELLANKLLDAKLNFAKKLESHEGNLPKL